MNIMLIGNGYDLHYKLPTKYINFLCVVNYMARHPKDDMSTVGSIFKKEELQDLDPFIADSYSCYKEIYDDILLDHRSVSKLINFAHSNIWFKYLISACNTDLGWIDFEKEIGTVCQIFQELFQADIISEQDDNLYYDFNVCLNDPASRYIIKKYFGFFFVEVPGISDFQIPNSHFRAFIRHEFRSESSNGSGFFRLNKKAIIDYLNRELKNLADMLNLYLILFVDNVCTELVKQKRIAPLGIPVDHAITLNYTHTFENINTMDAIHIHGSTGSHIVLGINADQHDELEEIDTTFICFKKYFQRVLFKTDRSYLDFVHKYISIPQSSRAYLHGKTHLYVIGHSLDITDAEIIKELFDVADEITILCHSIGVISSYIPNLVKICGKSSFDELRIKTNLQFKLLEDELPDILAEEGEKIKEKQKVSELMETIQLV